jgi:hypothetical protein
MTADVSHPLGSPMIFPKSQKATVARPQAMPQSLAPGHQRLSVMAQQYCHGLRRLTGAVRRAAHGNCYRVRDRGQARHVREGRASGHTESPGCLHNG